MAGVRALGTGDIPGTDLTLGSLTSEASHTPTTDQPVVGDQAREAVSSLRGYAYQVYAAALAWLDLTDNEELHLEVAEDFASVAREALHATQVKDTPGTISLATEVAREAILAFVNLVCPASAPLGQISGVEERRISGSSSLSWGLR
jgi:hypothetical protein